MSGFFEERELNGLAKDMQGGDSHAASKLYDKLFHKVFGFCMNRVGNRAAAEDLTQDIFLKLVDGIGSFDAKQGSFSPWFWRLARNAVIDSYRERRDVAFSDVGDEKVEKFAGWFEHSFERKWQVEQVYRFVNNLTSEERDLFELRFVADLSYRDISSITGKSEGALRVAVSRLKEKVRVELQWI